MNDDNQPFLSGFSEAAFSDQADPTPEIKYLRERVGKLENGIKTRDKRIGELSNIAELFGEGIRALPAVNDWDYRLPQGELKSDTEITPLLMITDAHAEETVNPSETEGMFDYSWNTFLCRLYHTVQKTLDIVTTWRQVHTVRTIHVFFGGDNITGDIHADGERTASLAMPIAIPYIGDVFGQALLMLCEHFDEVIVTGVCGNHGRKDQKPVSKQAADRNWDTTVYHIARLVTRNNPRIKWNIPQSKSVVVPVAGWKFLLKHGDGIKSGGTTPYYGLVRDTAREANKRRGTKNDFDWIIQGHLHHFGIVEGNRIICPSLIGPNEYSSNYLHSVYPAEQMLMMVHPTKGIVDFAGIKLEEASFHNFLNDELIP